MNKFSVSFNDDPTIPVEKHTTTLALIQHTICKVTRKCSGVLVQYLPAECDEVEV